jgi:6-pyruvoyltetrahydropterin/6-carboxytetrahydropterin synthase
MLTISKEFAFSASHILDSLPSWHMCARMHGHNYVIIIELSARVEDLTPEGFVRDFRDLDAFKKWIDETFDHRHLNDVMGSVAPTSENLAIWIHDRWRDRYPELTAVRVSETPKTWAVFRPGADPREEAGH